MADVSLPYLYERPKLSLPVAEAAKELGISRQALDKIIKEGRIKCHCLTTGGDRRVSYAELVRFVEDRESAGVDG